MPWRLPAGAVECGGECNEVWGSRVVQGGGVACQAGHVAEVSVNKITYFWAFNYSKVRRYVLAAYLCPMQHWTLIWCQSEVRVHHSSLQM